MKPAKVGQGDWKAGRDLQRSAVRGQQGRTSEGDLREAVRLPSGGKIQNSHCLAYNYFKN